MTRHISMSILFMLLNSPISALCVNSTSSRNVQTALNLLQAQSGTVYLIGSTDYEARVPLMNAACDERPDIIVTPRTDQDVSVAILAARDTGCPLSVRSGGHSYTCNSIKEGGIQIDTREMNSVSLEQDGASPTGLVGRLGTGATWGQVLRTIPRDVYSYPHGQCKSVGVGGYLLGGGVNWLGTFNKYGYGAENVLSMRAVLADGRIADVYPDRTQVISPQPETILHTSENNLFFALRGAGSSYGVVTEFRYIVHQEPETRPAILLAWADNIQDLEAIRTAAQGSSDYSITISLEYARDFWENAVTTKIYTLLFPPIMEMLRNIGRKTQGSDSYPVFMTVTDIRTGAGKTTDVIRAADYVKNKGVRLVMQNNFMIQFFHIFAEILYEANIEEQEGWTAGEYFLSSMNFGGLTSYASIEDTVLNDPAFGVRRQEFLKAVNDGCDYCFLMIHYRNRQSQTSLSLINPISNEKDDNNPTAIETNLVCMFKDDTKGCPALVKTVKDSIESNLEVENPNYSKYVNFPSCSDQSNSWADQYWGANVPTLEAIKDEWDPENIFNHCQSVGSDAISGQNCCPFARQVTSTTPSPPSGCETISGASPNQPCVFPFTYDGVSYSGCTTAGEGVTAPWCSTLTNAGQHVQGNWGDCDVSNCPSGECITVSGNRPGQPCIFPFRYDGISYSGCTTAGNVAPWCSTMTDFTGQHVSGNWGDCPQYNCPMA